MGFQVVFALKVRCTALEPRVWSEMVCFLLPAFSFPLQMVPSGRRALTSPEHSEPGGGGVISRVFVLEFRYRPINDFKRQMLSTRVPKWSPFDVFLRIGAKVKNMLPLERKPFWRAVIEKLLKKQYLKRLRRNKHFCKTWSHLDFNLSPRSLTILLLRCPKPPLEGRNDSQRFRKYSK